MSELDQKCIGYLKYYGDLVKDGCLDARKSADALVGFDEVLRYFIAKEAPELRSVDFEFPVRIQKGSWEIVVPDNIETILKVAGTTTLLTVYLGGIAKKAASDGFLETGPVKDVKKIVRGAMTAFRWIVEIAKHCGKLGHNDHQNVSIKEGEVAEIKREGKESLRVPYEYFKLYTEAPPTLLSKAASVIEEGREMEIAVCENETVVSTQITVKEKSIFYKEKETPEEIVLPELIHDEFVELEGVVTRCNEPMNNIGFEYRGHTLTCKPMSGSIVDYKKKLISKNDDHIYTPVKLSGRVARKDIYGEFKEKRPRIIFSNVMPLEFASQKGSLFPDDRNAE